MEPDKLPVVAGRWVQNVAQKRVGGNDGVKEGAGAVPMKGTVLRRDGRGKGARKVGSKGGEIRASLRVRK